MARNYIEKWAAIDELGNGKLFITIGDVEPKFFMGKFDWTGSEQLWWVPLNELDVSIRQGEKTKVKIYMENVSD